GSDADRYAIPFKYTHKLGDVFSLVAIHHGARAMFECPTRSARLEHNCIAAEFVNPDLHRRACAQAGIEEHERHGFPRERLRVFIATLESHCRLDQLLELLARHTDRVQQMHSSASTN